MCYVRRSGRAGEGGAGGHFQNCPPSPAPGLGRDSEGTVAASRHSCCLFSYPDPVPTHQTRLSNWVPP